MALPPTQLGWYDLEGELAENELQLERFLALRQVSVWVCMCVGGGGWVLGGCICV